MRFATTCPLAGMLVLVLALCPPPADAQMGRHADAAPRAGLKAGKPSVAMVKLGRELVINHDCAGCHGSSEDPRAKGYMAGTTSPDQDFLIGPCAQQADAKPCWRTRARNLTPDNATGIGRFTERQLFNALRFGLRPGETPDVVITSSTPGVGNFPQNPRYLAPPMPWTGWRHMSDRELWAIAAYLKHGLKPVSNRVADSDGPPDFWASTYTLERIGPYPAVAYPTVNEKLP